MEEDLKWILKFMLWLWEKGEKKKKKESKERKPSVGSDTLQKFRISAACWGMPDARLSLWQVTPEHRAKPRWGQGKAGTGIQSRHWRAPPAELLRLCTISAAPYLNALLKEGFCFQSSCQCSLLIGNQYIICFLESRHPSFRTWAAKFSSVRKLSSFDLTFLFVMNVTFLTLGIGGKWKEKGMNIMV